MERKLGLKKDSLGELSPDDLNTVVGRGTEQCIVITTIIVIDTGGGTTPVHTMAGTGCERPSCCSCTAISDTVQR